MGASDGSTAYFPVSGIYLCIAYPKLVWNAAWKSFTKLDELAGNANGNTVALAGMPCTAGWVSLSLALLAETAAVRRYLVRFGFGDLS